MMYSLLNLTYVIFLQKYADVLYIIICWH